MDNRKLNIKAVVLDFDGTICRLFEGYNLKQTSHNLSEKLSHYNVDFDKHLDPFDVYKTICDQCQDSNIRKKILRCADNIITHAECEAINSGIDVYGFDVFLNYAEKKQLSIAIATNNSEKCVEEYLKLKRIKTHIPIIGRDGEHPERMKPNSWTLQKVIDVLDLSNNDVLFVGDTINDYNCARSQNVSFVGMAATEKKLIRLQNIEDDIIIVNDFFEFMKLI